MENDVKDKMPWWPLCWNSSEDEDKKQSSISLRKDLILSFCSFTLIYKLLVERFKNFLRKHI